MQQPLTQVKIVANLETLGLRPGMAVEVHSSLSSLGFVEGGASTVIKALMEVVGQDGAIVMSAYTVTPLLPLTAQEKAMGVTAKVRKFAEDADCRSGMGVIADTFRTWPGTCLGKGVNRICAWGQNAHLHAQGYDYLLSIDGCVLLIGVDIHRCSSMHTAEDKVELPKTLADRFELPLEIQRQYPRAEWYVEYQDPQKPAPVDAWGKVQAEAERRGLIKRGTIGKAECLFFKAKPVVAIYEEYLRTDPFGLFGIDRE